MVKVCNDSDRWSLISLSNNSGKNVELKFVDSLRRQFEFSVDSFQIRLDSLLLFYECSENPMAETFHPSIVGESVYGDFNVALDHLQRKLICTRNPEEIRGGGLLKYCHLLVRGFCAASESEMKLFERYMCSRFFIDFSDVAEQRHKLESYLQNHFVGLEDRKYEYLTTLYSVVNESTVCLMGHERRQTLSLITMLAVRALAEQNVIPNVANVTCFYQPAPYIADGNFSNYYIAQVQPVYACQPAHTFSPWLPCNWPTVNSHFVQHVYLEHSPNETSWQVCICVLCNVRKIQEYPNWLLPAHSKEKVQVSQMRDREGEWGNLDSFPSGSTFYLGFQWLYARPTDAQHWLRGNTTETLWE